MDSGLCISFAPPDFFRGAGLPALLLDLGVGLVRLGRDEMEYTTVKKEGSDAFVEKKSRFIGSCCPVKTEEEALAFIAGVKAKYWDASHNVYAYILRNQGTQRFSDDGEPQGTAGIPVLETLKKSGIVDAVVVATRYFGGILLGGGGLIRAYSHTASLAVSAAQKIVMRECLLMSLTCDYTLYGKVAAAVPACGAVVDETEFLEKVTISFHLAPEQEGALTKQLADATNGKAAAKVEGRKFFEFL